MTWLHHIPFIPVLIVIIGWSFIDSIQLIGLVTHDDFERAEDTPASRASIRLESYSVLAPSLGLLGTVTGLIHAFEGLDASSLSTVLGGLSVVLTTTALGLIASFVAQTTLACVAADVLLVRALRDRRGRGVR